MKVIVTAGPTREFLDPVRFLSNRSTGKMGFAVAEALVELGHDVVLVAGPVAISPPPGIDYVSVLSAEEMCEAVKSNFESCQALVMAAAVADWRPERVSPTKLKKSGAEMTIKMVRTPDILVEVGAMKGSRIICGFAAETGTPVPEARRKLQDKGLDAIFANDVTSADAGFEADTNRITCILASGQEEEWPLMTKKEAGRRIAAVIELLGGGKDA